MKLGTALKTRLARNGIWAIAGSLIQSILQSLFYVIMARGFEKSIYSKFLVAVVVYQLLVAFSSLGLGQWFTREVVRKPEAKKSLVARFLKLQVISGVFFYTVNCVLVFLYSDHLIWKLILILGVNIIFDNILYGIRFLNIAEYQQDKTALITLIDSALKMIIACTIFVVHIRIEVLAFLLVGIRFLALNVFLSIGTSKSFSLSILIRERLPIGYMKALIRGNWVFIVIGSLSVVYWRAANFIVGIYLSIENVADYELSYRLFSLAQMLPTVIGSALFPVLVAYYNSKDMHRFRSLYSVVSVGYTLFGLGAYTFISTYANFLLPFIFGGDYILTGTHTKEMFLCMLVFPTALLQALVLTAMNLEWIDMVINGVSLFACVLFSIVGLHYFRSLSTVNYAVFGSFVLFHICQDIVLVRKKVVGIRSVLSFYFGTVMMVFLYHFSGKLFPADWVYWIFWCLIFLTVYLFRGTLGIGRIIKSFTVEGETQ